MDVLVAIVFALAAFGAYSLIVWGRARARKLLAEARLIESQARLHELSVAKHIQEIWGKAEAGSEAGKFWKEISEKPVAKLKKL